MPDAENKTGASAYVSRHPRPGFVKCADRECSFNKMWWSSGEHYHEASPSATGQKTPVNNKTDQLTDAKWLYEYQKLVINVRAWLSRGLTETAMREIDAMQTRWTDDCNGH